MRNEKDINRIFADKSACRHTVSVARVQIDGLGEEDLARVLAYEMEPYSAVPATEADVVWRVLPGSDDALCVFDVAVVRHRAKRSFFAGLGRGWAWLIGAGCAALTIAACDFFCLRQTCRRLEASVRRREPLQRKLDGLTARTAAFRREADAVRTRREEAVRAQKACARLRGAYLDFLAALGSTGGKTIVKTIAPGDDLFTAKVTLVAVDARAAVEALALLTERLADRGWRLTPGDFSSSGAGATVLCRVEARFRP